MHVLELIRQVFKVGARVFCSLVRLKEGGGGHVGGRKMRVCVIDGLVDADADADA